MFIKMNNDNWVLIEGPKLSHIYLVIQQYVSISA